MSFKIIPSHVAILVPSVRKAADCLQQFDFQIGKEEVWDGEGTKEIYVERDKGNALLLMEPVKPGAYQRALEKRGPGLHHLAIDVLNINEFMEQIKNTSWKTHSISEKTLKQTQTAWLYQVGFPSLIEVQQRDELGDLPNFVNHVNLIAQNIQPESVKAIGLQNIVHINAQENSLDINGHRILVKDLF